jgi:hypothetical protein
MPGLYFTYNLPRESVGGSGLSRANRSFVSQKYSLFIEGLLSETVNHKFSAGGIVGPDPRRVCAGRASSAVMGLSPLPRQLPRQRSNATRVANGWRIFVVYTVNVRQKLENY